MGGLKTGHNTCVGCGAAVITHMMLAAVEEKVGKDYIIVGTTGCMEVTTAIYPKTFWKAPYIHVVFENSPAVATGVAAAIKAQKKKTKVIVLAGDGGTYDIGFGALSGMLERGDNVTYICYDNGAYMNTGIQRSSATPKGAWTTTSPAGKGQKKKDILSIVAAHNIPYVASASLANPADFKRKIQKALDNQPSFVVVDAPCPPGWGYKPGKTMELARLAVETGVWPVLEIENGKRIVNIKPTKKPSEYFKTQKRFSKRC